MADVLHNIALATVAARIDAGKTFGVMLLKVAETDATLRDYETIQALLAGANTEADFTNYARQPTVPTVDVDHAGDITNCLSPDVVFASAGGTLDNDVVKAILFENNGSDATNVPLISFDSVFSTNGADVTLKFNATGFLGSSQV